MKKKGWVIALVVLLLILGGGGVWYMSRDGQVPEATASSSSPAEAVGSEERHTMGNPNAPVTLIEYAALTCPHCAEFNELVMPTLKSKYIDTGKVFYVFRVLPIGPGDFKAEGLAVCMPKEKYFETVDTLFRRQNEWGPMQMNEVVGDMSLQPRTDAGLIKLGGEMGLDAEKARSCMYDYRQHQILDKGASDGSLRYGITGVPAIIIGDKVVTAPHTPEELDALLAPLLQGK